MTERPSQDQVIFIVAHAQASRGTCQRAQVGTAIARDGRVLVTGYNGAPAGLPHCDHQGAERFLPDRPCLNAVHAEANALAYAARYGIAVEGADLFTTRHPCIACGQLIVNAGIKRVVVGSQHRQDDIVGQLFSDAGITVQWARSLFHDSPMIAQVLEWLER